MEKGKQRGGRREKKPGDVKRWICYGRSRVGIEENEEVGNEAREEEDEDRKERWVSEQGIYTRTLQSEHHVF